MGTYEYHVFKQLQIKLLLQGLYSGSGLMLPAQSATGNQFAAGTADVVSVSLHEAANFSTTVFTQNNVPIALNGQLQVNVPDMYSGTYYLHLKHRNSIGVVSALPVSMAGNPIIYDFTDAASKAFGNNQLDVDGFFALYGGDANQDGSVDALDLIAIDNASNSFATGYFGFDVNGDGAADALDLILTDNNALGFVQEITP